MMDKKEQHFLLDKEFWKVLAGFFVGLCAFVMTAISIIYFFGVITFYTILGLAFMCFLAWFHYSSRKLSRKMSETHKEIMGMSCKAREK